MTPATDSGSTQTSLAVVARPQLRDLLTTLKEAGPDLLKAYAKDIIERDVAVALFEQDGQLARVFALSGYFTDVNGSSAQESIAKAMAKVQLGRSWHMEPADAMQHIYLVNGRPALQNEFLAARMRDGGLDWEIEWHRDAAGECIGCTLWPSRLTTEGLKPIMERVDGQSVPASVSFKKADAARVLVKEDGKWIPLSDKATYKAWAEDMYFWRCISRLRKRYAPNILSGVLTRAEAEDLAPVISEQKSLPAPAKLDVPAEQFRPSREARKSTVVPEIVPAAPVAQAAPVQEPAPVAEDPESAKTQDPFAAALAAYKAIRIKRGIERFNRQMKAIGLDPNLDPEAMPLPQFQALVSRLHAMPEVF